ncbi:acyltransferase family protein [Arthrobacter sp. U41]|uniref:acyltransferase family protein n=1 Tax=Arthrobacter sp. U41 TaxID=1849032 RepID=UPI00119E365B|nr:acyltransferase family protein [Arthrobacter sp. U41]
MSGAGTLVSPRETGARHRSRRATKFRPEIQGLRSLAVLMVVTYHIWFGRVSGGVDVFLLISAFLMTLQFMGRYESGSQMALIKHWLHLFRRLLPAAALVILSALAASYLLLPRTSFPDVVSQSWASLFYVENRVLQADAVDYYAADHATASPLQHFWSLSIQGQVFILWPLIFAGAAFLARRYRLRYRALLSYIFAGIFLASLAFSVFFTATSQTQAYFDTGSRLWEFALGTLLALFLPGLAFLSRPVRVFLGWAGVLAMLSCGFILDVEGAFPGFAALWPTLAAGCVILAGQTQSRWGVDRLLSAGPLVKLGDNSYALYLWHWPVLVLALAWSGKEQAGWLSGSVIIAVSLGLAFLTTRFVERPWRSWAWPEARRRRAALAVALCIAVVAAPLTAIQLRQHSQAQAVLAQAERNNPGALALLPGFVSRADSDTALLPIPALLPNDWATLGGPCSDDLEPVNVTLRRSCGQNEAPADAAKTVLVLGDSHAQQWLAAVDAVGKQNGWRVYSLLKGGCRFSVQAESTGSDCQRFNAAVRDEVTANPPDAIITVGTVAAPSSPAERLTPGLEATAAYWNERAVDVVAIRDNPRFNFNIAECVVDKGPGSPDCLRAQRDLLAAKSPLAALEGRVQGLAAVDMTDLICDGKTCPGVVGNTYVYKDNNHLSRSYVASMSSIFGQRLFESTGWK